MVNYQIVCLSQTDICTVLRGRCSQAENHRTTERNVATLLSKYQVWSHITLSLWLCHKQQPEHRTINYLCSNKGQSGYGVEINL